MDGLASYDSDSSEVNADIRAQENLYKKSFEYGSHFPEHQLIPPSQNMDIYPSPPRLVSREDYANFTEPNDGNYDSPPLLSRSDSPSPKDSAMVEQYMKPVETNGAEYSMPGTSKQEPVERVYLAPHMLENFQKTESNLNMLYEPEEPLPENYSPSMEEINVPVVTQEQAAEKGGINEDLSHSHIQEKLSQSKSRSASKEMQSRSRSRSRSKELKCAKRKSRSKSHDRRSRSRDSRSKSREKVYKSRRRSRSKGRRSRSRGRRSRSKGASRRRSRSGSRSKSSRRRSRSKGRRRSRSSSRSKKRSRRSRSHERRRRHRSGSHEHSSRRKPSRPLVDEFGRDLSSRKRSVSPPKGRTAIEHASKAEKKYRSRSSDKKKATSDEDSDHSPDSSPERKRSPKGKRKESGRNLESPERQLGFSRERSRSPKKRERKHSQSPSPDRKSRSPRKRSRLRSSRSRTPRRRSRSRSPRRKSRSRSPVKRRHRRSRSHSRSPKYKRREEKRRRSRTPPRRDRNSRSRSRSPFYGRGRRGGGGGGGYDSAIHAQEALARRLEKAKKMQDQKRKELEESAANEPKRSADEIAKALSAQNLTGANAQVAFQAAYAELQAKALATTGIAVPSYYNPMAVNPLQYAAKAKKRQLLWSSKKTETAEQKEESTTSSNQWEKTSFGDAATKEKFRRLMGIKADSGNPQDEDVQKQEDERLKLFSQLDQEYQVARIKTHTQRSFGLGFAGHAAPPAPGPSTE